eukprot:6204758-Pleurochrysis_carterae.AAC.2
MAAHIHGDGNCDVTQAVVLPPARPLGALRTHRGRPERPVGAPRLGPRRAQPLETRGNRAQIDQTHGNNQF